MTSRGSLGSTLNSNINTGPHINVTKRTGLNLAKAIGSNIKQNEFEGTAHDITDGSLMVNECDTQHTAQIQTCIGKDTVPYGSFDRFDPNPDINLTEEMIGAPFPCAETNVGDDDNNITYHTDARQSQFIRDIGDARNEFEYFLRKHQIALFIRGYNASSLQPHLQTCEKNDAAVNQTTRRITIWLEKSTFNPDADNFREEFGKTSAKKYFKLKANETTKKNLFVINNYEGIYFELFKALLYDIISDVRGDTAYISKEGNRSDMTTAKMLAFSGVSLTYGYMSAKNGDTAITTNIFSARTDRNGPFRAHGGDDVFWLHNCELEMFDKHTNRRHIRFILTPNVMNLILTRLKNEEEPITIPAYHNPNFEMRMRPDQHAEAPGSGNSRYLPFVLASCIHSNAITANNSEISLRDIERKIGKIVSGGPPSSQIDWVNGCSPEL